MAEAREQLTEGAKAAIWNYLWKIFIPSAFVLSISSAALGFLINKWAYGDAYVKAYGEASSEIVKMATAVGLVKGDVDASKVQVDAARKQAEASKEQAQGALQAAADAQKKLNNLVAKDYEDLATNLLRDEKFKSSLANVDQDQLKALEGRIGANQRAIETLETDDAAFKRFPELTTYSIIGTFMKTTKQMGRHKFCALGTSGASHSSQACTCVIEKSEETWALKVDLDPGVRGACNCAAFCAD